MWYLLWIRLQKIGGGLMKSKAVKFNKPAQLSKNQLAYLKKSVNSWLNIAEGG